MHTGAVQSEDEPVLGAGGDVTTAGKFAATKRRDRLAFYPDLG